MLQLLWDITYAFLYRSSAGLFFLLARKKENFQRKIWVSVLRVVWAMQLRAGKINKYSVARRTIIKWTNCWWSHAKADEESSESSGMAFEFLIISTTETKVGQMRRKSSSNWSTMSFDIFDCQARKAFQTQSLLWSQSRSISLRNRFEKMQIELFYIIFFSVLTFFSRFLCTAHHSAEIIVDWWIFHLNFSHFILFLFLECIK